jgi:hypothetical protein
MLLLLQAWLGTQAGVCAPNRLGVVKVYSKFGNTFLGVLHLKQDETLQAFMGRLTQQASTWMPFGKLPHKYLTVEMCSNFKAFKFKDSKSQTCESKSCNVGATKVEAKVGAKVEAKVSYKALVFWDVKPALDQLLAVHSPSTGKMYDEHTKILSLGLRKTGLAAEVCVYRDATDLTAHGLGPGGGWSGRTKGAATPEPSYGLDLTYLPCLKSVTLEGVTLERVHVTILGFPPSIVNLTVRRAVVNTNTMDSDSPFVRQFNVSDSHVDVKFLAKLSGLRWLRLEGTDTLVDALFFDALRRMTQLEALILEDIDHTNKKTLQVNDFASSLHKLSNLLSLNLHEIGLHGKIPSELHNAGLRSLCLSNNHLTGTIPSELGLCLQHLSFRNNKLSGPIPTQIGKLIALRSLNLSNNLLSGNIPSQLGKIIALWKLNLSNNLLSCNIPTQLAMLPRLSNLIVGNNQLTGSIPTHLGTITTLQGLDLSHNQLSGKLPSELGQLLHLRVLKLNSNQLSGTFPSELGRLLNLRSWTLHTLRVNNMWRNT